MTCEACGGSEEVDPMFGKCRDTLGCAERVRQKVGSIEIALTCAGTGLYLVTKRVGPYRVGAVYYSRAELEELRARISEALGEHP